MATAKTRGSIRVGRRTNSNRLMLKPAKSRKGLLLGTSFTGGALMVLGSTLLMPNAAMAACSVTSGDPVLVTCTPGTSTTPIAETQAHSFLVTIQDGAILDTGSTLATNSISLESTGTDLVAPATITLNHVANGQVLSDGTAYDLTIDASEGARLDGYINGAARGNQGNAVYFVTGSESDTATVDLTFGTTSTLTSFHSNGAGFDLSASQTGTFTLHATGTILTGPATGVTDGGNGIEQPAAA